jgi:hypothetical protein
MQNGRPTRDLLPILYLKSLVQRRAKKKKLKKKIDLDLKFGCLTSVFRYNSVNHNDLTEIKLVTNKFKGYKARIKKGIKRTQILTKKNSIVTSNPIYSITIDQELTLCIHLTYLRVYKNCSLSYLIERTELDKLVLLSIDWTSALEMICTIDLFSLFPCNC